MSEIQLDHEEEKLRARIAELEQTNARLWGAVESARDAVARVGAALSQLGANGHLPSGEDGRRWWDDAVTALDDADTALVECGDRPASDKPAFREPTAAATYRCSACGYATTPRPGLIEQLRADGGDGPCCVECHRAGRPDSLLRPAGAGEWSTGRPR